MIYAALLPRTQPLAGASYPVATGVEGEGSTFPVQSKICWIHIAMTKRNFSGALFMLLTLASAAFALDINGKWKGNLASPNGDLETTMVFKVDGEKLTGAVTNMYGEEQIAEGSVKGDDVNFVVNAGGGQFKIVYKGKVTGQDIKFHVVIGDFGEGDLLAKRT